MREDAAAFRTWRSRASEGQLVVNHRKRFVFIHVPKTGGSSIVDALQRLPGSERRLRLGSKHLTTEEFRARFRERTRWQPCRISAYAILAFVRNPWDRMASLHRFLGTRPGGTPVPPFEDFLRQLKDRPDEMPHFHSLRPQSDFVDSDAFAVGYFESLQPAFAEIGRVFGFESRLGHEKKTEGTAQDYRRLYPDWAAAFVGELFCDDVARFGYCFDDPVLPGRPWKEGAFFVEGRILRGAAPPREVRPGLWARIAEGIAA